MCRKSKFGSESCLLGWPIFKTTFLTHILTHTGLAHSGLGRFQWIRSVGKSRQYVPNPWIIAAKVFLTAAHNPEVGGSSPSPATKSVTVADTISATVIFYFPLFCRRFLSENGGFSEHFCRWTDRDVLFTAAGCSQSTAWENCNRYKNINDKLLFSICIKPSMAGSTPGCGRLFTDFHGTKGTKRTEPSRYHSCWFGPASYINTGFFASSAV